MYLRPFKGKQFLSYTFMLMAIVSFFIMSKSCLAAAWNLVALLSLSLLYYSRVLADKASTELINFFKFEFVCY